MAQRTLLGLLTLGLFGCDEDRTAYDYIEEPEAAALDRALASAHLDRDDLAGDEPRVVVEARDGHVTRIAFGSRVQVGGLAWVSELRGLERVEIMGGSLPALDGLAAPCTLEELRLAGTHTAELSALSACPSLRRLYLVEQELTSLGSLPPLPALEELYVDRTPIADLEGVAGRPALTTLLLTRTALTSLAGLERLPALTTLDVSHNALSSLTGLGPALPRLASVDVSHNVLTDASALDALPAVRDPNLAFNRLTVFPNVALREAAPRITDNPGADAVFSGRVRAAQTAEAAARRAEVPTEHVATLPDARLSLRGARNSLTTSTDSIEGTGGAERLEGAGLIQLATFDPLDMFAAGRSPGSVRLTVSIASGALRVFFAPGPSGYPYVDVRPGAPVVARGALRAGTHDTGFYVQTLEGPVTGFTYRIEPAD